MPNERGEGKAMANKAGDYYKGVKFLVRKEVKDIA